MSGWKLSNSLLHAKRASSKFRSLSVRWNLRDFTNIYNLKKKKKKNGFSKTFPQKQVYLFDFSS